MFSVLIICMKNHYVSTMRQKAGNKKSFSYFCKRTLTDKIHHRLVSNGFMLIETSLSFLWKYIRLQRSEEIFWHEINIAKKVWNPCFTHYSWQWGLTTIKNWKKWKKHRKMFWLLDMFFHGLETNLLVL